MTIQPPANDNEPPASARASKRDVDYRLTPIIDLLARQVAFEHLTAANDNNATGPDGQA